MLSLARRPGQKIRIGEDIVLVIREIRGRQVKIGIEAPAHVRVLREEIYEELCAANQESVAGPDSASEARPPAGARSVKVRSSRFGELVVPEETIVTFPEGLPGFTGKRYFFMRHKEGAMVEWLHSVDDPDVAVMTADPSELDISYDATPKPAEVQLIDPVPDAEDEMICRVILRTGDAPERFFVNLFAPVYLNVTRRLAMQVPRVGSGHSVREPWPPQ